MSVNESLFDAIPEEEAKALGILAWARTDGLSCLADARNANEGCICGCTNEDLVRRIDRILDLAEANGVL